MFGSRERHLLDVHRILVHHVPWILTDTLPELAHGLGGEEQKGGMTQFYGDLDGVASCYIYIYILTIWMGVPFSLILFSIS